MFPSLDSEYAIAVLTDEKQAFVVVNFWKCKDLQSILICRDEWAWFELGPIYIRLCFGGIRSVKNHKILVGPCRTISIIICDHVRVAFIVAPSEAFHNGIEIVYRRVISPIVAAGLFTEKVYVQSLLLIHISRARVVGGDEYVILRVRHCVDRLRLGELTAHKVLVVGDGALRHGWLWEQHRRCEQQSS